ncbi:unnamed protein product [Mytilus coruscus]|uniref:Uncharacterized protein n=1 Tax=Mytilus coruscus TaxID=42192 RepID=A0A6J8DMD1_MYTCO|nr:unnamed protein product [Mytilus coruscus]
MVETENKNAHELDLIVGDNVYLSREPVGQGRKFQHIYDGPFTVTCLPSAHLVLLRDPTGKRNFRRPVHINRLKLAHIRAPLPAPYFNLQTVESENSSHNSDNSSSSVDRDNSETSKYVSKVSTESEAMDTDVVSQHDTSTTNLNRPRRNIQKPVRYRDDNFIDPDKIVESCDTDNQLKVKRILAKRKDGSNFVYLIQKVEEPAQNAIWVPLSKLPPKAQTLLLSRPPPLIQ